MTCTRCGAPVTETALFCSKCGTRVKAGWGSGPADSFSAAAAGTGEASRWSEAADRPFRFAGGWWTRDHQGRVGTWDQERERWVAADFYATPFFMRRPAFTSLRTPAIWLYVLFGLYLVATIGTIAASAHMIGVLDRLIEGRRVSFTQWDDAEGYLWAGIGFMGMLQIAIAGVFIWWTRRATCNVPSFGAVNPEFGPGWSVGWWFIPFANLVQPLRVLNQAWRASSPDLPAFESPQWRKAKLTALLPAWWIVYLAASTASSIAYGRWDATMDAGPLRDLTIFLLIVTVAMGAIAVVTIGMVASLTRRQDVANARFDLPAGLAVVPGEGEQIAASPPPRTLTSV